MAFANGDKLGPYEILSLLGKGGMGEVYRARDTKLNREVAIKVLPPALANDADFVARFQREAQTLAALNHPNIATIYGLEGNAIIMELVEGNTLKGPMPLDEALPLAKQIAEALEAAHDKGIIHLDLKPGNVKVTPAGVVKVLDFGLAKSVSERPTQTGPDSPTLTMRATEAGLILGTAAYMSPEQAAGKQVDRRADIWSFGVVLYEVLTGKRLFDGESVTHILADVVRAPIDLRGVPMEALLKRCLDRNLKTRLQHIGEARIALENPVAPSAETKRGGLPWGWAAIPAVAAIVLGAMLWRAPQAESKPMMRLALDLGPDVLRGRHITVAISPDGTRIAYMVRGPNGKQVLATRKLDESKGTVLADTEGAFEPFFSPDNQWIGFFTPGAMKKISVQGGAAVTLYSENRHPRGAAWGDNGFIVANLDNSNLVRVPEAGGKPERLPGATVDVPGRWPQVLPSGNEIVYTSGRFAADSYDGAGIMMRSQSASDESKLTADGYFGRHLPSGHLVYVRQGGLYAQAMDLKTRKPRGLAVPILEDVAAAPDRGAGQFDVSRNGTLVYLSGKPETRGWVLSWVDQSGKREPVTTNLSAGVQTALSPDGGRIAFSILGRDVVIYEPKRDTRTAITVDHKGNGCPVWMPDGKHLLYSQNDAGKGTIWWTRSDGSGERLKLFEAPGEIRLRSASKDGRHIAFGMIEPGKDSDLWTLPLDLADPARPKPGKPEIFLKESGDQREPYFSPDGHWIAYGGIENDKSQIFVRPFPTDPAAGKWRVSSAGGVEPIWSRDGKEIVYVGPDGTIMAASVSANGKALETEKERVWSQAGILGAVGGANSWHFELSADGKRILTNPQDVVVMSDDPTPPRVVVLVNFFDELRRRVPPAGK